MSDETWGDWDDNDDDESTSDEEDKVQAEKDAEKAPLCESNINDVEKKIAVDKVAVDKEKKDSDEHEEDIKKDEEAMDRGDDSVDGDLYMKKQSDFVVKKAVIERDEHKIVKASHIVEKAKKLLSPTCTT